MKVNDVENGKVVKMCIVCGEDAELFELVELNSNTEVLDVSSIEDDPNKQYIPGKTNTEIRTKPFAKNPKIAKWIFSGEKIRFEIFRKEFSFKGVCSLELVMENQTEDVLIIRVNGHMICSTDEIIINPDIKHNLVKYLKKKHSDLKKALKFYKKMKKDKVIIKKEYKNMKNKTLKEQETISTLFFYFENL